MRIKEDKDKVIDLLKEQSKFLVEIGEMKKFKESNVRKRENIYDQDYARILYSSSFRRLQGKMQLFPGKNNAFYRNRLTHSLEVQQITKSIAIIINETVGEKYFPLKNITVVQSGALAHDIGNPPFGHSGERKLNEIMKEHGGFEGNAQSLRVLMHVERKKPYYNGLNLTYRTLLSVVKYYKKNENGLNKKFIYDEDYEIIKNEILIDESCNPRTIDVQIVDLADEIAYCTHDLEDALRNNYFSIDDLIFSLIKKLEKLVKEKLIKEGVKKEDLEQLIKDELAQSDDIKMFKDSVEKAKLLAEASEYDSIEDYSHYFRKELSSILVNKFIEDIGVADIQKNHKDETGTKRTKELGFVKYAQLISNLKKSIFEGVTRTPEIIEYEKKGDLIIQELFDFFVKDENRSLLPPEYRYQKIDIRDPKLIRDQKTLKFRKVCDYISGMMDTYAIELHENLKKEGLL